MSLCIAVCLGSVGTSENFAVQRVFGERKVSAAAAGCPCNTVADGSSAT